jgi:hypothetical protein
VEGLGPKWTVIAGMMKTYSPLQRTDGWLLLEGSVHLYTAVKTTSFKFDKLATPFKDRSAFVSATGPNRFCGPEGHSKEVLA